MSDAKTAEEREQISFNYNFDLRGPGMHIEQQVEGRTSELRKALSEVKTKKDQLEAENACLRGL